MKTHSTRKGYAAVWKALAVAVAAAYASTGVANVVNLPFSPPAADVYVYDCGDCQSNIAVTYDFDGLLLGDIGDLLPRIAIATQGGASAKAESSKNVFTAKAIVAPTKVGEAQATAQWLFIPHDPQGRAQVTLDLKLKMTASQASPDPINADHPGAFSYAGYGVLVCGIGEGPGYVTYDESGTLIMVGAPDCGLAYYNFGAETKGYAGGTWRRTLSKFGHTVWTLEGQGADVSDVIDVGVTVIPGLPYFLKVSAVARTSFNGGEDRGAAYAAVDPVLEPDSVNPDVTIEFPNLAPDPNPQPVMGDLTPEALAAMGLNPQPLVELGFFDPPSGGPPPPPPARPSDTVAPSTTATPSSGPNAGGWNNGPVTVKLAAEDNAGGSGLKEIHIALAGATMGSRVEAGSGASVDIAAEGETTLTYYAVDNAGNQEAAKTLTVRIDKVPPTFAGLPAAGCALWPPNHQLVQVASASADDSGSGVALFSLDVTSNEPETGTGQGDASPDIVITGGTVQLRAERAGNGAGRLYTITARATDKAGNIATATSTCAVPHDRS